MTREHVVMITGRADKYGVWCDWCQLPSAIRITTTMISEQGALDLATFVACECGTRRTERDWA